MKTILKIALMLSGFIFAVVFGMWAKSLFTISESVHFSVNFPAGEGVDVSEVMNCCDLGGPWAGLSSDQWYKYPSGGVLVWGREGSVILDVGREGFLKRALQPGYINLSSHWIRNVGVKPYQIQLDMQLCDMELDWETHEASWDPVGKVSTRQIEPGEVFNMDWYFWIPAELLKRSVVCEGTLEVLDAQTQASLSLLPITIINSRAE